MLAAPVAMKSGSAHTHTPNSHGNHGYPQVYAARGSTACAGAPRAQLRWSGFPEPNKVVQPMQVPGGRAHGPQVAAVTAVLAAPTPNNCKIQPQLQNLPRFQPPDFEGEDGQLPRPDSPCSTPREAVQEPSSDCPEDAGPFPAMSFVEYKSRSSNQWILAKVESYNPDTQSYRLDVQPYAPADRVRARRAVKRSGAQVEDAVFTQLDRDRETEGPREPFSDRGASKPEEVELLRRRVAELEEENRHLHAQVAQEMELKERYRQELCDLRRGQKTPR